MYKAKPRAAVATAATEQKPTVQTAISQTSRNNMRRKPNKNELDYNDYLNSDQ